MEEKSKTPLWASIWFYIGMGSLVLVVGPCAFGFLGVGTWGAILIPVIVFVWLGPLVVIHWVLWGRVLSRAATEGEEDADQERPHDTSL